MRFSPHPSFSVGLCLPPDLTLVPVHHLLTTFYAKDSVHWAYSSNHGWELSTNMCRASYFHGVSYSRSSQWERCIVWIMTTLTPWKDLMLGGGAVYIEAATARCRGKNNVKWSSGRFGRVACAKNCEPKSSVSSVSNSRSPAYRLVMGALKVQMCGRVTNITWVALGASAKLVLWESSLQALSRGDLLVLLLNVEDVVFKDSMQSRRRRHADLCSCRVWWLRRVAHDALISWFILVQP